jgi:hypothetical protein
MNRRMDVSEMEKVRKVLKNQHDIELKLDDVFFDRLHDKIMAQVAETNIEPPMALAKTRQMLRAHWRSWLGPVGGVMSVAFVAGLISPLWMQFEKSLQRSGLWSDGEQRIAAEAVLSLDELPQTFIVSQSESDFFIDVANNSIKNLSVDKLKKALGKKRN